MRYKIITILLIFSAVFSGCSKEVEKTETSSVATETKETTKETPENLQVTDKDFIKGEFGSVGEVRDGLIAVSNQLDKWGFIDLDGNQVIDFQFAEAKGFINEVARVKKNDLYGFIDKKGETIIPIEFLQATDFFGELAVVQNNDKSYAFIDKSGEKVKDFVFASYDKYPTNFAVLEYSYYNNDEVIRVNSTFYKTDGTLIEFENYDGTDVKLSEFRKPRSYFSGIISLVMASKDKEYSIVNYNTDGKIASVIEHSDYSNTDHYIDGFIVTGGAVYDIEGNMVLDKDNKIKLNLGDQMFSSSPETGIYYLVNAKGEPVSESSFSNLRAFNNGIARGTIGSSLNSTISVFIKRNGELFEIPPEIKMNDESLYSIKVYKLNNFSSSGFALVEYFDSSVGKIYTVFNDKGEMVKIIEGEFKTTDDYAPNYEGENNDLTKFYSFNYFDNNILPIKINNANRILKFK